MGIELRGGRKTGRVGRPTLEIDGADGLPPLRTSPFVFTQAQAAGSRALVRHVARRAAAQDLRVLELYAGAGNFTRALARSAARVWASDTDHEAVELLRGLATAHHLPINAKRQSAPRLLAKLAESNTKYDVIVLDPPRAGLGQEAMVAACKVATSRIVYVSCDPATSRRDLEAARSHGFEVAEVAVLDLMPMTPEIELVATLVPRSTWTGT
jgi:23S rRNA (uracil1939-C5)-methyltransferase